MVNNLKDLVKLNITITDLKSDALKERHWKKIFQQLGLSIQMSELTLGHMWDADLRRRQVELTEILTGAAGEMALEEFMKTVKDCWSDWEVSYIRPKGGGYCCIIWCGCSGLGVLRKPHWGVCLGSVNEYVI